MNKMLKTLCLTAALSLAPLWASEGYTNNDILISAKDAIKLIGDKHVMFVSGDSEDIYTLGHIKGSVSMYAHHLHHADIMGNMHCEPLYRCLDDAEHYIGSKGISNDMQIIAYDDFKGANATGVYSFFKSYGHDNIKILNGGRAAIMALDPAQAVYDKIRQELRAEKKIGKISKKALKYHKKGKVLLSEADVIKHTKKLKASLAKQKKIGARLKEAALDLLVIRGEEDIPAKEYHLTPSDVNFSHIADKHEVLAAVKDIEKNGENSQYMILDARSMIEIIGERKMDNVARGGHIPGATFMEWKWTSDLENKKSFKSAEELQRAFDHFGVSKDKTVYAYCMVGSGRGSQLVTAMELLGYKHVKVFTGSWDTWGNDMNLPIKR